MSIVFAHDHKFRMISDAFYSTGGLSNDILCRYTKVFGNVTVLSRIISTSESSSSLSKITNPQIKILNAYYDKQLVKNEVVKSDAVIARLPSKLGTYAVFYARKYRKPYMIELVACPWDSYWNHSLKGKLIAPFITLLTKQQVKKSSLLVYVTNKFLQERYPTNGKSICCSNVALPISSPEILERRIKKINGMDSQEKIVIGTAAAVNVLYKGQQYIIKALGRLKNEGITNYEYQLVGAGDNSFLKRVAEKNNVLDQVKFMGSLPHNEVFNWLDNIDIYAQPSRQEGLPRALIEALSRGCPAFGARTGGIPELLNSDMIFSNTKRNIAEIRNILLSLRKNELVNQSICNINKSKEYNKELIEERRTQFFLELKASMGVNK